MGGVMKIDVERVPSREPSRSSSPTRGLDQAFNLVELLGIFRRRIKLFFIVFGLITLAGVIATSLMTPTYSAMALLKIQPSGRDPSDTRGMEGGEQGVDAFMNTEISVATSRRVGEEIVDEQNLLSDPDFNKKNPTSPKMSAQEAKALVGRRGYSRVVDAVLGKLNVSRQGTTYILNFAYTSPDPDKAARLANAFSQHYLSTSIRLRTLAADEQARALEGGINKLNDEAHAASAAAANYRAQTGLVDATGGTVLQQQATAIAAQLSSAEGRLATTEAALQEALQQRDAGATDTVVGVLGSPVVQNLRSQRASLLRDRAEIATRYGPKHPEYLKIQQQLEGVDALIQQEMERVIASLRADAKATQAEVGSMRAHLASLQAQLAQSSRTQVQADALDAEAKSKADVYNQYNLAQAQAVQAQRTQNANAVLLTPAVVPTHASFPNKPLFDTLGAVLGLILGLVAVFLAEVFDPRIINARDAEAALGMPMLASVPLVPRRVLKHFGAGPEAYVVAKPMSAFAEAFRSIRSGITFGGTVSPKVICMTSALPAEGKSVTTLSFARILGLASYKVVVVDCDLRRSSLANLTGARVDNGLVEVVTGKSSLTKALIPDETPNVSLLPLSGVSFSPEDLLGSPAFTALIEELRGRFDYVLLDTPPVLAVADARAVALMSDTVVFLCRWSKTPRVAAAAALRLLEQDGAPISGVVLNMVDLDDRSSLSAEDPAYYHRAYEGYYVS
jgi:capsular exopolysaccharide synthesis family protein